MLQRPGTRGRRLFAVDRLVPGDRSAGGRLLRRWPAHLCGPGWDRIHADPGAGLVEAAASARKECTTIRPNSPRRGPALRCPLGRAEDRDRSAIARLDRGWAGASGGL